MIVPFLGTTTPDAQRMVELDEAQRAAFGDWLRKHREALGLSQTEAGRKARMSRTQYTRLEHGETGTKRSNIESLAKAVGADLFETYRLAGYDPPKDLVSGFARSRLESIHRRSKSLRAEQKKRIELLIELVEFELDRFAQDGNDANGHAHGTT